jgi:hypothetical protein
VADPLGKVNPGDGFVIRAATWNAFVDAARAHRKNEAGRAGAGLPTPDPLTPGCTVLVKNATGSTLPAWSTVKLGSPVVDAATYPYRVSDQPVFPATTPDGSDIPFAVTEEPIRDGKLGRAVVLGVAVADVSVSDSGHGYAAPASSSLVLASGTSGPARIIWKESGTGTLKAVVLIDRTGGGDGAACEAAGCDGLVGLEEEWCLRMTLACHEGRFAEMDEDQFAAVFAWYDEVEEGWIFYVWDPEVPDWVEFEMDWGGGTGVPILTFATDGTPVLTVGSLVMYYEPCATGGRFTGGPRNGFTGGTAPELCEPNAFTVVVECSCCPIDGWQGPDKTYCILVSGDCETGEKACAVLTEEDACDTDITICSGTYEDEASCELVCDPPTSVVTGCCEAPSTITLTMVTFATGSCDLVWNGSLWAGSGSFTVDTCGAKTIHWELRCNGGSLSSFEIRHSCDAGANWSSWIAVSVGVSCNPIDGLNSEYTLTTAAGCETCVAPEFSLTGSF